MNPAIRPNPIFQKLSFYFQMIKIEHSLFALPFAYLGLFLAVEGWPSGRLFWWVTLAMVSFRAMAMGLNRLIDRQIDAANPRTKNRELPQKKLSSSYVWFVTIAFGVIFLLTTYALNSLCFKLAIIPILLAYLYPWTKRFTWFAHVVLGVILGLAPYGAWLASGAPFSWIPAWVMIGVSCWVTGFDIIYALQDLEFDKKFGLYSIPTRFGASRSLQITAVLHILTLFSWLMAGWLAGLSFIYLLGVSIAFFLIVREHWLIHRYGLEKIQEVFFSLNACVSVVIFLSVLIDLMV